MRPGLRFVTNELKLFMSRSEQLCYDGLMKKLVTSILAKSILVLGLVGGSFVVTDYAHAASCSAQAAGLASSMGGSVLSVSARGNKCVIVLLIRSRNGPPKRKTFVVSK
jgi:hypothetical protein